MDGLLGVAGMMTLLVMTGIIPENSLRLAPVRFLLVIPLIPGPIQYTNGVRIQWFHPRTTRTSDVQPMFALTSLARASDGYLKEAKLKMVGGAVTANVLCNFVEVVPGNTQKMRSHGPGNWHLRIHPHEDGIMIDSTCVGWHGALNSPTRIYVLGVPNLGRP